MNAADDARWMAAALALGERGRGLSTPNPSVGCVIVRHGRVVGRGWTQPGGRPHAEAMALDEAGDAARGATVYTTLEPCAHRSPRGPACADRLVDAGVARVVLALGDPDPRTNGAGVARLTAAGIAVVAGPGDVAARRQLAGFLLRRVHGRPAVTLKLATSLDGCIARADGESRWITGAAARAHAHLERARHDAILVGRGTLEADAPRLDVRLPGLEGRSPMRIVLTTRLLDSSCSTVAPAKAGASSQTGNPTDEAPAFAGATQGEKATDARPWQTLASPADIATLDGVNDLLVEGGAGAAAAFLAADLVDRLLLYRAPILIGGGRAALGDIGLAHLADAHGRWRQIDARALGSDRLEVYERVRG